MEQPPGSLDDLQPQDLSTATVIDLTRKGELGATSLDGLRAVKSPGWYPNSGSGDPAFPSPEAGSADVTLQSGDQIQPDDAFSHTTVTLSYVSRSHVHAHAAHDALSRHPHLCGVPPISKFSLRPPCEAERAPGAPNHTNHQHYSEPADGPVDLAAQTKLFHSSSQARAAPEDHGARLTQEPCEFNGGVVSSDGDSEGDGGLPLETGTGGGLENGEGDCCSGSGERAEPSAEALTDDRGCDELFIVSGNHEPAGGTRELYSLGREFRSPLEDPASPSATSLDDVDDVFVLPRASSSPSGDNNSLLGTADAVAVDDSSADGATQPPAGVAAAATRPDSGEEEKQPVRVPKPALEPLIDLTDDICLSDISEENAKTVHPHVNGKARVLQRTLPVRTGRGMRLEAIVMNINSSRYKVSGCINTSKKAKASHAANDARLVSPAKNDNLVDARRKGKAATAKRRAGAPQKGGKANSIKTDICKDSTSDSELVSNSCKSHGSASARSPQRAAHKRSNVSRRRQSPQKSKRKPSPASSPRAAAPETSKASPRSRSSGVHSASATKSPKSSPGSATVKAAGRKTPAAAKTKAARAPKRRRGKAGPTSSMFCPEEPEIKLKYVNYKERRELRLDSFSPFVHVERRQASPSLCTVVNYPEEAKAPRARGQQQQGHPGGFVSAVVPNTSCLQLGRPAAGGQHRRSLVCCLCGLSANAMDLGDLHGPYYPEGYQSGAKASTCKGDKDDYSDSDSSSSSVRHAGRKRAVPPAAWPLRPAAQKGGTPGFQWTGDGGGGPEAKRARPEAGLADAEDWYSAPVLPLEPCEYWLHEDCGVWSAGVFLVKGKVYGLEEAARAAQETTCSACGDPGATLGCFFKSCPNKYHFRCALESDCVLIEDNFSMKCKKHKNKTFKAPAGNRRDHT